MGACAIDCGYGVNLMFLWSIGLVACCVLLQLFMVIPVVRDPDMLREDKWDSLRGWISSLLVLLMIMGMNLHWPDFAQAIIVSLLFIFLIWNMIILRRPRSQIIQQGLVRRDRTIARLRSEGIYPPEGQVVTDDDIKRLLKTKYKIYAYSLYRQIHHVDLKEAATAIKRMKQEMKDS